MGLFSFGKRETTKQPANRRGPSKMARMYQAGSVDRLTASWGTTPLSSWDIITKNHSILVARSREQAANNDHARAFLREIEKNVVGARGIVLQSHCVDAKGKPDQWAREAIETAWDKWSRKQTADVGGTLSWVQIQRLFIRTVALDGECFARIIRGRQAGPWGFAVELIDGQLCPVDNNDDLSGGNIIRHGIEFNSFGRPVAYYFRENGARNEYPGRSVVAQKLIRVDASDIIHGFIPEMVGQRRGMPWMATALFRMKQLSGYEDAALVAARVGAAKMGFFTSEFGDSDPIDDGTPELMAAEAGEFMNLPPGMDFKAFEPNYPQGEFASFQKGALRGISAGLGIAYNTLAQDLEGVNFSSIRAGVLSDRDTYMALQEWLRETLVEPVFHAWLERSLLAEQITVDNGKPLKAERIDKYRDVTWQPRRWAWVDPLKDISAATEAIGNGLRSPGDVIREQGRDPEDVWREFARDLEAMKAAGIPDEFIQKILMGKTYGANNTNSETDAP